ncbi:Oleosin [Thalictrum thalictroides]|uniref:Oleosin n=1 Tax=Thalictrum thalictroides TaxID=46969 RepID=A0A7J6XE74_THATH|nr:Oleosin [Thalictrum thalictroides]
MSQKPSDSSGPTQRQTVKFITAATIGTIALILSGLTLTGTVIALVMATPVMFVFSPILIPAGIVVLLAVTGFMFAGGLGVAAITALTWIYNYVAGKHPPGSDQFDNARMRLANKARDVKDRAKEYGQYAQNKVQEASQQQTAA